jgi:hypothetical protein
VGRWTALAAAIALVVTAVVAGCSRGGDEEAFCERLRSTAAVDQVVDRFDADDPAGSAAAFREAADDLGALADDAPSDIEPDVDVLADVVGDVADGLAGVGRDDRNGAIAVLDGLSDRRAELQSAGEEVARYAADRCDVTLVGGPPTTAPTAATTPTTAAPPTTAPPTTAPPTTSG